MNAPSPAKIVRCPYCVLGDGFRQMIRHIDGRYICNKCGHVTRPDDAGFMCSCCKCQDLNLKWVRVVAPLQVRGRK
jgi:hypothetical protein